MSTGGLAGSAGEAMHALVTELYPICRSITGQGFRDTIARLQQIVPLELHQVPTGTRVLDWTVPNEWNIRDAWIRDSSGRKVVDFQKSSLHVVNYSTPVKATMSLAELKPHLFSLPDQPDLVPYRTSYYKETWGFCLAHRELEALRENRYEVVIDSTLAPGNLAWGELFLPGERQDEILFSCHSCHPSLANDNLAGVAVAVEFARRAAARKRALGMRFLFIPGIIGSITWLAQNEARVGRIAAGLVLSCLGDAGHLTYKKSRRGDTAVDRAAAFVLKQHGSGAVREFVPYGYDERQYCSPGYNLAVGCLTRTPNGKYPEYHTSADNPSFVKPASLEDSLAALEEIVEVLEHDARYRNLNPKGEPQLGRRGLYQGLAGTKELPGFEMALLWVLNQSDGVSSLLDIAEKSGIAFATVLAAARALEQHQLLERIAA